MYTIRHYDVTVAAMTSLNCVRNYYVFAAIYNGDVIYTVIEKNNTPNS